MGIAALKEISDDERKWQQNRLLNLSMNVKQSLQNGWAQQSF